MKSIRIVFGACANSSKTALHGRTVETVLFRLLIFLGKLCWLLSSPPLCCMRGRTVSCILFWTSETHVLERLPGMCLYPLFALSLSAMLFARKFYLLTFHGGFVHGCLSRLLCYLPCTCTTWRQWLGMTTITVPISTRFVSSLARNGCDLLHLLIGRFKRVWDRWSVSRLRLVTIGLVCAL